MKTLKSFRILLSFLIMGFSFAACDNEDKLWDIAPIILQIQLSNENGEDLLHPDTPGSYADKTITATYQGKTYTKDVFEDNKIPYGRAYLATLFGIYTVQQNNGCYALKFGELDGEETYENETITLDWADGTQDVITFSSRLKWKGGKPKFNNWYKLNGKEVDNDTRSPIFKIRK